MRALLLAQPCAGGVTPSNPLVRARYAGVRTHSADNFGNRTQVAAVLRSRLDLERCDDEFDVRRAGVHRQQMEPEPGSCNLGDCCGLGAVIAFQCAASAVWSKILVGA